MATGIISSTLAPQPRPTPPTEPPAKIAAALIAASRGPAGVDTGKLAARVAALDPRDPSTAPVRAAVNAALTPVDRGRLLAALDRATADISVRLKDGTTVVADRDGSSANGKTLAALRDSSDPKERAQFRSVISTYGSIPAAEAALFGPRPAQVAAVPVPAPRPTPPAPPAAAGVSQEGVGSFFEGVFAGDFSDNSSWSKVGGQVVTGFIPIAGQVADVRDIAANVNNIREGKPGGWFGLGTAVIGIVPGFGDAAKAALRGGGKVAGAGAEVAEQVARHGDEVGGAVADATKVTDEAAATAKTDAPAAAKVGDGFDELAAAIPLNVGHVLEGEVRVKAGGQLKAVGFHHRPTGADPSSARMTGMTDAPDVNGVYRGRVEVLSPATGQWVAKQAQSSFFPDRLSSTQIETAIRHAYADALRRGAVSGNGFEGASGLGFQIKGYIQNGAIDTAFPIRQ